MKDTAKVRRRSQETTAQLTFAAMMTARATLHEAVIQSGMTMLSAMLEDDRTRICRARYVHDAHGASRAEYTDGELALGRRRATIRRPRVRDQDGELPLSTWEHFASADPLTPRAVEQMVPGVSTRNYARSIEPAPLGMQTRGVSRSVVSRRFVGATQERLTTMMSRSQRPFALRVRHRWHSCRRPPRRRRARH